MRPNKAPDLPLHRPSSQGFNGYGEKLTIALEKSLDMAGLKKTKTGSGEKEKAYVVKTYTMLMFIIACLMLTFVGASILITTYLDLVVVKRSSLHDASVNRVLNHAAQTKLMSVHLQLQKALDSEVHETVRLEEYRSFVEQKIGDAENKILAELGKVEAVQGETNSVVAKYLKAAEDEIVSGIDMLIGQFQRKAKIAKKQLEHISRKIIEDIELDEKEQLKFAERLKDLGASSGFDYKKELSDEDLKELGLHKSTEEDNEFGEIDDEDIEIVKRDIEHFYLKLQDLHFPVVESRVIQAWENQLQKVIETLEDSEKETDLEGFQNYVNSEILHYAPEWKTFEPKDEDSIVDYFENIIYQAKLAPYKQNLLDMYSGWKQGRLSPYQVIANIEEVAESEQLFLIYEWLNGFREESVEVSSEEKGPNEDSGDNQ